MKLRRRVYSFILHTCRLGDRVRIATNPFTGAALEIPIDEGLTAAECDAVRRLFENNGVRGPEPEFEGYALYLPEDGSVRFRGGSGFDDPGVRPPTGFDVEVVVVKVLGELRSWLENEIRGRRVY